MPDPIYITALRNEATAIAPEAEGVLITRDGDTVLLELDDGQSLTFSADEIAAALEHAA